MYNPMTRPRLAMALAIPIWLFIATACVTPPVYIGSPHDRYDHNRTKGIVVEQGAFCLDDFILLREHYAPPGTPAFPRARMSAGQAPPDQFPDANIVPIFTGVPLPLDDRPPAEGSSDRDDLIEFLAAGTQAGVGVESPGATGDLEAAAEKYGRMLSFLAQPDMLKGKKEDLLRRFEELGIKVKRAREVIDSRYALKAFADVLAAGYGSFWFVFFKAPDQERFSRLVVVPRRDVAPRAD
jgi:hypothetical protein